MSTHTPLSDKEEEKSTHTLLSGEYTHVQFAREIANAYILIIGSVYK